MQIEQTLENTVNALKGWQFIRNRHGSLYDRGAADSYYGRWREPHYGGVGGDSGPRVEQLTEEEVAEYNRGYTYNEMFGDRKDWN